MAEIHWKAWFSLRALRGQGVLKVLAECAEAKEDFARTCGAGVACHYGAMLGMGATPDSDTALSPPSTCIPAVNSLVAASWKVLGAPRKGWGRRFRGVA